jgi:hypothetical protein
MQIYFTQIYFTQIYFTQISQILNADSRRFYFQRDQRIFFYLRDQRELFFFFHADYADFKRRFTQILFSARSAYFFFVCAISVNLFFYFTQISQILNADSRRFYFQRDQRIFFYLRDQRELFFLFHADFKRRFRRVFLSARSA